MVTDMDANRCDLHDPEQLYDSTAHEWIRTQPVALSDFTARPIVLDSCMPLTGARCLDLGCGEGYCARLLKRGGAAEVLGIDVSAAMIAAACEQERHERLGITYQRADATDLRWMEAGRFDRVVAVFLFNYLDCGAMQECLQHIRRVLRVGGRLVFCIPHPLFPYVRPAAPPFMFDVGKDSYYAARNRRFAGRIWRRDGVALDVQLVHKTFEDCFTALHGAGFSSLPIVRELTVTPQIAAIDPAFFEPLQDVPLHVLFSVQY